MKLGQLLDISEFAADVRDGYISVRQHPDLPIWILNYNNTAMFDSHWTDAVCKCRGLVVSGEHVNYDSEVISRPFYKFFNLNQSNCPETMEAVLPKSDPLVTEKMDGWFGILWKYQSESDIPLSMVPNWDAQNKCYWGVASRGSFESPGAVFATGKLAKLIKYGAINEFPAGYTPIFEIIAKETKVVVEYPFEGLVLLGAVNVETGEDLPYEELQACWARIAGYSADNRPWIRLVKAHRMSIGECVSSPKTNFEGFVLSYPRLGTWPLKVKVKLEDYKRLHKLITGVTPQEIWRALHDPMAPWLSGDVPDHFRTWSISWRDTLYQAFQKKLASVMDLAQWAGEKLDSSGMDRTNRKILMDFMNSRSSELATIAMALLSGKIYEAHQAIWNSVRPKGRESEVFYREGQGE